MESVMKSVLELLLLPKVFYSIGAVLTIVFLGFTIYVWRRRWLYYYASKLPGPFAFPLIGSIHLMTEGPKGVYKFLMNLYKQYPSVFKIWLGPNLYVTTTEPKHLKIIMTRFLDKGNFYHLMSDYFKRALAAAPLCWWRKSRKFITPSLSLNLINSFMDVFVKQGNALADRMETTIGRKPDDVFPIMWKHTLDAACETLTDVDPDLIETEKVLPGIFRLEEILLQRFFNPILHLDIFWWFSPARRELINIWKQNCAFIQQIIEIIQARGQITTNSPGKNDENSSSENKRFLDILINLEKKKELTHDYVLEEGQIMFFVGTETSSVTMGSTLVVLGIYPEIQDKIDDELYDIFGDSDRDSTLEDINQMNYLERVIKETMRLLPPIPFIMRDLDENLELEGRVFPAGSRVIIPIVVVHRKPEYWPDPLKFDPDRFLPEQSDKRPPCAYMPFSYGVRNCLGYKYAMLSMKVMLSAVLRRYRVKSSNYKSIDDIELLIHVIAKAKDGYKVELEKKKTTKFS